MIITFTLCVQDERALAIVIDGIHVVFVFTLVGRLLLFAEKIGKLF
jgi:hypothetical protein